MVPGWLREPRWAALATSFLMVVLVQGISNSFSVFLLPLSDELGGLRSAAAAAFSIHNLAVGLVATVVDRLMERFGERPVLALGAWCSALGVGLAGTASRRWSSCSGSGWSPASGAGFLGSVAQTVMLNRWFPTARGAVNGIALSGMGLGIFLFAPLSAYLIARVGWRMGVRDARAGTALLLLPTAVLTPSRPPGAGPSRRTRIGVGPRRAARRDSRNGAVLVLRGGVLLHARLELHGDDAPGRPPGGVGVRRQPGRGRVRAGRAPVRGRVASGSGPSRTGGAAFRRRCSATRPPPAGPWPCSSWRPGLPDGFCGPTSCPSA